MTEIINKSFGELDKFPLCCKNDCFTRLEIQNRFVCNKCSKIFCCDHRIDFNHNCSFIKNENICILIKNNYKKCSQPNCNCKLTEINKFKCKSCDKEYCTSHRLDFIHNCK